MNGISKQQTGFRFGKYRLKVLQEFETIHYEGRTYKIVEVQTDGAERYISLRLYNGSGKFIKQFLMEPKVAQAIGFILHLAPWSREGTHKTLFEVLHA